MPGDGIAVACSPAVICVLCNRPVLLYQASHRTCPTCGARLGCCFACARGFIPAPWWAEQYPGPRLDTTVAAALDQHRATCPAQEPG